MLRGFHGYHSHIARGLFMTGTDGKNVAKVSGAPRGISGEEQRLHGSGSGCGWHLASQPLRKGTTHSSHRRPKIFFCSGETVHENAWEYVWEPCINDWGKSSTALRVWRGGWRRTTVATTPYLPPETKRIAFLVPCPVIEPHPAFLALKPCQEVNFSNQ